MREEWVFKKANKKFEIIPEGMTLVDKDGNKHPYSVLKMWKPEIVRKVFKAYPVRNMKIPEGFQPATGECTYVDKKDYVERRYELEKIPDDEIAPPPEAEPAPPPQQSERHDLKVMLNLGLNPDEAELAVKKNLLTTKAEFDDCGYFGNIWIRQLRLPKKGDYHQGHRHAFDHITILAKGSVLCEVVGQDPKKFVAPTFIAIGKNDWHRFVALEDDVMYWCVYAIRNKDGEVIDGNTDVIHINHRAFGEEDLTAEEVREKLAILSQESPCGSCSGCQ